jgi:acyl transferase domain-containing protein
LETWGVYPEAVVGHSSGEIAAAYAASLLTAEEAIKVAYFRGQACATKQDAVALGMLAAGLGPEEIKGYLDAEGQQVQIGCYNSPNSVTLSGDRAELERIRDRLVQDGYFARMLLVNFAYHSKHMAEPAISYEEMLRKNCGASLSGKQDVRMFSSVSGKLQDRDCDADYWKANMISPVRFDEAVREMVAGRDGADFLIEICPNGALSGPVAQIKKALGDNGSNIQYCSASARGKDSIKSLFDVAGRLFVANSPITLSKVNQSQDTAAQHPSVIVDLPNYKWNHLTKYWYESESSKDWRFRKYPHHDLLGSKILGTSWNAPSWKKTLRVENLHWLRDHRVSRYSSTSFMTNACCSIDGSGDHLPRCWIRRHGSRGSLPSSSGYRSH